VPVTTHGERLIALDEARRFVAENVRPGPTERIDLSNALGRVLAEPVAASYDYPPFDKAMMDGYAVRAVDTRAAPCNLDVIGEVPAGTAPGRAIGPGQAIRINTGAPLPPGADAVVPVEETAPSTAGVRILSDCKLGRSVAPRGSVRAAGQVVLEPPLRLRSAQISALAAAGAAEIAVYRVCKVAIIVTGDELVRPGERPRAGQIVESNDSTLVALTRECGGDPVSLGITRDDSAALQATFSRALEFPIVVAVGGMSKGTLDIVPSTLERLGVRWLFQGVDVRPGKPTAYGIGPGGQHVFGLPGNPMSCLVCYLLFVRMAIDGLRGMAANPPSILRLRLDVGVKPARDPRPAFLPASANLAGDPCVRAVKWHGSGDPFSVGAANAFIFQPRGDAALDSGAMVDVLPMPGMIG